jgi:proteasome accessory factor PafA2
MSIPKVMGIEQEYAVTAELGEVDLIRASYLIVGSFERVAEVGWDYQAETPFLDARGFASEGEAVRVSRTDNLKINNLLLNGARFYVDHAHPELATAECLKIKDAIAFDRAGERIITSAARQAEEKIKEGTRIRIYKNNSDRKGNSYGCHENYLISTEAYHRIFPPSSSRPNYLLKYLLPFFVTRQLVTGAGKVGAENGMGGVDYQISQRADFFETILGAQTTTKRPLINTRDEPHADRTRFRRLHVIIGDANMSEYTNFLKLGTTAVILKMVEDDALSEDLELEKPVEANLAISRQPDLKLKLALTCGRRLSPLTIQRIYYEQARDYIKGQGKATEEEREVVAEWGKVLKKLADDPFALRSELDWVIKLWLLDRYRGRRGISWNDPRLKKMDLLYHLVDRRQGLYFILEQEGELRRVAEEGRIRQFISRPPDDTRAYFRGECFHRFAGDIVEANWDSLTFDIGGEKLIKVPLPDPTKGTITETGELFSRVKTVRELLAEISA